jgi:ankyrin repeat protein
MLSGNISVSSASRHPEARQVQAQNDASLLRFLLKAPREVLSQIVSSEMKEALSSDLFEKRSSEAQTPSEKLQPRELQPRELQLLVLNKCILPEERESFLKKALTQANRSNAESDFSSILNPVCMEQRTTPYLSKLLETAAWQNQTIAFDRLVKTVQHTKTFLPENTYELVAECGQPEKLKSLLRKTSHGLSPERQEELKDLAKAQKKAIKRYSTLPLDKRQKKLEAAVVGITKQNATENRRHVIALLQTPGINVNATNPLGLTAIEEALILGRTEVVNTLLLAPDININRTNPPQHVEIIEGHSEGVNALLNARDINVNAIDTYGYTLLHMAVIAGRTDAMSALLNTPDIDVNAADNLGFTSLHLAAQLGHTDAVRALLNAPDIDVSTRTNQHGLTPLHIAAIAGHTETVNALLNADDIQVNATDNLDFTPLHIAAMVGNTETVNALLGVQRIDINARDKDWRTPLQWAARRRNLDTVNALWQAMQTNRIQP